MEGPRTPAERELSHVIDFLNSRLRKDAGWSISAEYPTALVSANMHNIRIVMDQSQVVSHAVLKPLIVKSPHVIFKVGAIGSVVTDPAYRNQGLSTQIIQNCITEAQKQNCDIAVLWTDMYDFYRKLGFELAGSEISLHLSQNIQVPSMNLKFTDNSKVSPDAILRIYNSHTCGTVRTLDDIKKFLAIPKTKVYTAWDTHGKLAAYAIEGKGADLGGYLHEWGGSVQSMLALIAWIQTQRTSALTLIAPKNAQNMISHLETHGAIKNNGYLGMIKILNFDQLVQKVKRAFRAEGIADIVLEKTPAGVIFGIGTEIYTLEKDAHIAHLLFGPIDYDQLDFLSDTARVKLTKLLPLPLWLWGWDSI
jgi:N-acetylglutamate synthase-like GNAT family acetyltransferase